MDYDNREFPTRRRVALDRSPEDRRMCGCWVAAIPLIAAGVSAAATVYSSNQQRKAAESAANASQQAATAAPSATQSAKAPSTQVQNNAAGIDNSAVNTGAGNTLLTGATGVDPNQLGLGRNTLGANTLLGG